MTKTQKAAVIGRSMWGIEPPGRIHLSDGHPIYSNSTSMLTNRSGLLTDHECRGQFAGRRRGPRRNEGL